MFLSCIRPYLLKCAPSPIGAQSGEAAIMLFPALHVAHSAAYSHRLPARLVPLAAFLCTAFLGAAFVRADEVRLTTLYRTGNVTTSIGAANFVIRDILGDSHPEIVSCSSGSAVAVSYDGTTYAERWRSPYVRCSAVAVAYVPAPTSDQRYAFQMRRSLLSLPARARGEHEEDRTTDRTEVSRGPTGR